MISVNIASLSTRKEQLVNTIKSLVNQCDIVNVCLNNYTECPFEHEKVNYFYSDNVFTDAGKFLFARDFDGYYLTCDDDLEYPPTYVEDMVEAIDNFGVVSHHGRTFVKFPIDSYYKTPSHRFRCLDAVKYTETVQIVGTGVCGFHTSKVRPPMSIFKTSCMSDIYFSLYCDSLGIDRWVLAHEEGYIKYQDIPVEETIWGVKHLDCEVETKVINDYFLTKQNIN